jgi:hypothetical protein
LIKKLPGRYLSLHIPLRIPRYGRAIGPRLRLVGLVVFIGTGFVAEFLRRDGSDVACAVQHTQHLDAVVEWPVEDEKLAVAGDGEIAEAGVKRLVRLIAGTHAGHAGEQR